MKQPEAVYTTLEQIKACSPCESGYEKLLRTIGRDYPKDKPIYFSTILESNGFDDTLWVIRTTDKKWNNLWRHFAVDCAEMVEYLMTDERSKNALVAARKHAEGKATDEELDAAAAAAAAAAGAAAVARAADWAAAGAAAVAAARAAAGNLLLEYCRTGERVDWLKFFGGVNPMSQEALAERLKGRE